MKPDVISPQMLTLAKHVADVAGDLLRGYFRTPVPIEAKADLSPVTHADRVVESALRKLIEAQFPDHGIIGEEYGSNGKPSPYQWVIDPIDGTKSFMAGYPLFTTLIALTYEQVPVLGLIDQPINKERWFGAYGEPTTCNQSPINTRAIASLPETILSTTSTYYFSEDEREVFERLRKACGNVILGGDSYAYAMLASGQIDLVVDAGLKPFDFCALRPVIEGAGGIITDWAGKSLTTASDGRVIAAANRTIHQAALGYLS